MKLRPLAIAASLAFATPLFPEKTEEFVINLKDPEYLEGIVRTEKGGVITAPDLRVQAQKITYKNTKEEQLIFAQGDLMMQYQGRIYVGETLEFNLLTRTGYLKGGRTKDGSWYVGGDWIELLPDGNFFIYGAFITTSTSRANPWEIKADTAHITDGHILTAKDVRFKALDFPLLWIPYYKTNLTKFRDPPIRYRLQYDTNLNIRASVRYRFYSTETFAAFARFDYRFKKNLGPGGALEADYLSQDKRTVFQTKNYGALDKSFPDENGVVRYRFQGIYKTKSEDEYTRFHVQWDRLSDNRMISDFKDPDFEINTQKVTYLEFSRYRNWTFAECNVRPKINPFQSLAQELPYAATGLRPFEFWKTGIIMENYASGSYLDYTYANVLDRELKDRKSGRLETINSIYRPFSWRGFNLTPRIGLVGIHYSDSPDKNAVGQFLYTYGGEISSRFSKIFPRYKHTIIPYAKYLGYTRPSVAVDDYFVFDLADGYTRIDQIRFGVRQLFFTKENSIFLPGLALDIYAYSFWGANSFTHRIPKVFANLEINRQNYAIFSGLGWNIQENVLDYGNAELLWTLNSSFALGVELRHRSKFWWRKAVHNNYIVDFARPLDQLLASPLSDRRNTFLTKAHIRFSPRWNMQFQFFHGWDRLDEPNYSGAKVDFYTMLTGNWQMKVTYEYQRNDPFRFSYSFKLIK